MVPAYPAINIDITCKEIAHVETCAIINLSSFLILMNTLVYHLLKH